MGFLINFNVPLIKVVLEDSNTTISNNFKQTTSAIAF
jgi:hypothetical protein